MPPYDRRVQGAARIAEIFGKPIGAAIAIAQQERLAHGDGDAERFL